MRAICLAYSENCRLPESQWHDIYRDSNEFIKHGVTEIETGALKLQPLMDEYLKQFKLTWVFICTHIFHRWVTTDVISMLRNNPSGLTALPFFSLDFMETVLDWPRNWRLLQRFYESEAETARRKRIYEGQRLLKKIRGTAPALTFDKLELEGAPAKGEEDWIGILLHIRTLWRECDRVVGMNPRENRCRTCDNLIQILRHAWDCDCRLCAITGGFFPFLGGWQYQGHDLVDCTRCYRALQLANRVRGGVEKRDFVYHLSWAVFKHLPGRLEYIVTELQVSHICVWSGNCSRVECLVAQSVLLGHYPKDMAEFLVDNYRPVDETVRFQVQPKTSIRNVFVTLLEEDQLNKEVLVNLLAEVHLRKQVPEKEEFGEVLRRYLKATGKDVELDLTALPVADRSNFMGPSCHFPVFVMEQITKWITPVYDCFTDQLISNLLGDKNGKSVEILEELIRRYKDFMGSCRYFVENVELIRDHELDDDEDECEEEESCQHHQQSHKQRAKKATKAVKSDTHAHHHGHSHGHNHHNHHHNGDDHQHSECCSLFGHGGEWQRSRSNETRERLRKKLHQFAAQQNGGAKEAGSKSRSIQRKTIDKNNHEGGNSKGFYKTLENVLLKMPQMNLTHKNKQVPEMDKMELKVNFTEIFTCLAIVNSIL